MSRFDDAVRHIAHLLWESRGRPHGSDQHDWFTALSLVNAATAAQSEEPAGFFHCFTREGSKTEAFSVLESMLEMGILLTPEALTLYPPRKVTQCRLSLAFIPPHELFRHSGRFGPFALRMASYETLVGEFGASPVWYVPSFIRDDGGPDIFKYGAEIVNGLAEMQTWLHDMRNDPSREAQRHEPHRLSRLVARLLYPTHYKNSDSLLEIHYLQREWRIVRRDSPLDRTSVLTEDERNMLLRLNPSFFSKPVNVWDDDAMDVIDLPRIDATRKLKAQFSEVVAEILVPGCMVEEVRALKPGVPVVNSEQYQYGYHP